MKKTTIKVICDKSRNRNSIGVGGKGWIQVFSRGEVSFADVGVEEQGTIFTWREGETEEL